MEFINGYYEISDDIFSVFDDRRHGVPIPYVPKCDIFYLVQAVSCDLVMGAGIAKEINNRYGFRNEVISDYSESIFGHRLTGWTFDKRNKEYFRIPLIYDGTGYSAGVKQTMRPKVDMGTVVSSPYCQDILAITTKVNYYDKPTYDSMLDALLALRGYVKFAARETHKKTELIMPTIGCGLDKLSWSTVKEDILDVFSYMLSEGAVQITVVKR